MSPVEAVSGPVADFDADMERLLNEPVKSRRGRPLSPCGTYAAYARHMKAGETPCEPCKQANTLKTAQMDERKRKIAAAAAAPFVEARAGRVTIVASVEDASHEGGGGRAGSCGGSAFEPVHGDDAADAGSDGGADRTAAGAAQGAQPGGEGRRMSARERIRVTCDARHCTAQAFHPAKGWSHEDGNRDFCRKHTEERAARFICPPDHKHAAVGTCYVIHKCRCDDCREHIRLREERRKRAHLYGRYDSGLVDAAPVREHIQMLQASGLGWKRIAELTGVGNTAISQLIYGRKGSNSDPRKGEVLKRVSRAKAEKILALQPSFGLLRDGALVPAVGTHRRIQALVCNGWSLQRVGERLGIHRSNMTTLMRRDRVEKRTHDAAVALFEELWQTPAPAGTWHEKAAATRARRYAEARRWLPALAWDDPDTDVEPPAGDEVGADFVDDAVVWLAVEGERPRLTPAERREVVRVLHRERWGDRRIAAHVGMASETVLRIRGELGLPGLAMDEQVAA